MTASQASNPAHREHAAPKRRARGRPRLEQVADIDKGLVEVALMEFLKHGYGGTSMATIVKAAGISKTTLYSRYSSKEELFVAMMKTMVEGDLSHQIRAVRAPARPLEDMLREFAFRSLEIALDPVHFGVIRLIYGESHRFPELRDAGEQLAAATQAAIVNVLDGYAEREGISFTDLTKPARMLTLLLRGTHLDLMLEGKRELDDARRAEIGEHIALVMASIGDW